MVAVNPVIVDARRLLCPMPVIRVQNKIENLSPGTVVEVICTDPGALNDIPSWCRINGHQVLEIRSTTDEYVVVLEVGSE